ncbi:MAG: cobalamin biosynthesis protein, partial [Alphaproteobacteria bacterium]|nr:cobalamin biosynthesis protein [Alphaproteobacteria bacterium]
YASFGLTPRRMDAALKFFPARIAGLLTAAACAFVPGASAGRALRTMLAHAKHHRSQAAGWPIGALAGGLGLALAGPRRYPQEIVQEAWIGTGRARLTPVDLKRGGLALTVAAGLNALLLCLLVLLRLGLS